MILCCWVSVFRHLDGSWVHIFCVLRFWGDQLYNIMWVNITFSSSPLWESQNFHRECCLGYMWYLIVSKVIGLLFTWRCFNSYFWLNQLHFFTLQVKFWKYALSSKPLYLNVIRRDNATRHKLCGKLCHSTRSVFPHHTLWKLNGVMTNYCPTYLAYSMCKSSRFMIGFVDKTRPTFRKTELLPTWAATVPEGPRPWKYAS